MFGSGRGARLGQVASPSSRPPNLRAEANSQLQDSLHQPTNPSTPSSSLNIELPAYATLDDESDPFPPALPCRGQDSLVRASLNQRELEHTQTSPTNNEAQTIITQARRRITSSPSERVLPASGSAHPAAEAAEWVRQSSQARERVSERPSSFVPVRVSTWSGVFELQWMSHDLTLRFMWSQW